MEQMITQKILMSFSRVSPQMLWTKTSIRCSTSGGSSCGGKRTSRRRDFRRVISQRWWNKASDCPLSEASLTWVRNRPKIWVTTCRLTTSPLRSWELDTKNCPRLTAEEASTWLKSIRVILRLLCQSRIVSWSLKRTSCAQTASLRSILIQRSVQATPSASTQSIASYSNHKT